METCPVRAHGGDDRAFSTPTRMDRVRHSASDRRDDQATAYLHARTPGDNALLGHPLLSAETETCLANRIALGDMQARNELVTANLRLVASIARRYAGRGLPLEDLIAEGTVGLFRAAQDFDPHHATRFSTYAAYWIRKEIRDAINRLSPRVHIPGHTLQLMRRWHRTERLLEQRLGRSPSFEEVGDELHLGQAHRRMVRLGLKGSGGIVSLLEDAHSDGAAASGTTSLPEAASELADDWEAVARRLEGLDERLRIVITMRFGLDGEEPRTLRTVADRLGVTREWARRLEVRALAILRGTETRKPAALSA